MRFLLTFLALFVLTYGNIYGHNKDDCVTVDRTDTIIKSDTIEITLGDEISIKMYFLVTVSVNNTQYRNIHPTLFVIDIYSSDKARIAYLNKTGEYNLFMGHDNNPKGSLPYKRCHRCGYGGNGKTCFYQLILYYDMPNITVNKNIDIFSMSKFRIICGTNNITFHVSKQDMATLKSYYEDAYDKAIETYNTATNPLHNF
jgi:hypothetical protein